MPGPPWLVWLSGTVGFGFDSRSRERTWVVGSLPFTPPSHSLLPTPVGACAGGNQCMCPFTFVFLSPPLPFTL